MGAILGLHPLDIFRGLAMLVGEEKVEAVSSKGAKMEAYCLKCRTKREMKNAKAVTLKNGRPATQGVCPTCSTKMFRIGKG